MPRSYYVTAERIYSVKKYAEFYSFIAENTGVRCFACNIAVCKIAHNRVGKFRRKVKRDVLKAEPLCNRCGIDAVLL